QKKLKKSFGNYLCSILSEDDTIVFLLNSVKQNVATKNIPGPLKLPFIGSIVIYEYTDSQLEKKYRTFGVFSVDLFVASFFAVTKPSIVKNFFENYNSFSKQNYILQKGELFLPNTLLVASPKFWRLKRKFYSPVFTSVNLKKYETIINRESKYMLDTIDSLVENYFDIKHIIDQHLAIGHKVRPIRYGTKSN
ncbi:hypothetical protein B4U80_14427, partial [Leptotrombidium deliense]